MSDPRIDRLEERIAWLEHHVTKQDKAMLELSEALDLVRREYLRLRERAESSAPTETLPSAGDDRPPHY
jgi:SlyX protein